ncbi:F0F1 ATP synthase subunit epsilon [Coprothermobacteraceae bacterium]|nr:F0F1 ATP synthase subunit epsilon [Coprothermobacteraceae bacterium]
MLRVSIVSSDQTLFFEASEVLLPLVDGYAGILERHSPFVASLEIGIVTVKTPQGDRNFAVAGGVASVRKGFLRIVTPAIYETDDLNAFIEQLDKQYQQAKERLAKHRLINLNP